MFQKTKKEISKLFKNRDGEPFEVTTPQAEMFHSIVNQKHDRVSIKAVTQYGKSDIAGMGADYIASSSGKKILIIGPSSEQAQIIMGYVIDHVFDNPIFLQQLEFEGSLDRFKRERNRNKIDWKTGATIGILTANAAAQSKQALNLMGEGADIIIVDESALIPDKLYSKIIRMVGGRKNSKVIELYNPFVKNHTYKHFYNPRWKSISVNWQQAVAEGRFTQEFIDEMRTEVDPIDFQIFYDCEWPDAEEDSLIPTSKIEEAVNRKLDTTGDPLYFGGDVASKGGDKTVGLVRRGYEVLEILKKSQLTTMETVGFYSTIFDKYENNFEGINVDSIGIGAGVVDRFEEILDDKKKIKYDVRGVNVATSPRDKKRYLNLRAQLFWEVRTLFMEDKISIPEDPELMLQLGGIKFSFNSSGKIQIESKDKMRKRGLKSPDCADALALSLFSGRIYSAEAMESVPYLTR